MSNLIPSLETFAKAGHRSVQSLFGTTPQAERVLLALLCCAGIFILYGPLLMVGSCRIHRGQLQRPRD